MNSRKEKVSKVILLAGFVCAQALLGPARPPEPVAVLIAAPTRQPLTDASTNCARAPRELRFEMIAANAEVYPPPAREAVVCLAVYRPVTD